jgi:hypothetical protein
VGNRLKIERLAEQGRRETRAPREGERRGSIESILSEDDPRGLLLRRTGGGEGLFGMGSSNTTATADETMTDVDADGDVDGGEEGIGDVLLVDGARDDERGGEVEVEKTESGRTKMIAAAAATTATAQKLDETVEATM